MGLIAVVSVKGSTLKKRVEIRFLATDVEDAVDRSFAVDGEAPARSVEVLEEMGSPR